MLAHWQPTSVIAHPTALAAEEIQVCYRKTDRCQYICPEKKNDKELPMLGLAWRKDIFGGTRKWQENVQRKLVHPRIEQKQR